MTPCISRTRSRPTLPAAVARFLALVCLLAAGGVRAADLPTQDPAGPAMCCKTGGTGLSFTKELATAPFPFAGKDPDTGMDFLGPPDAQGTRWRVLPSGARFRERGTYDDSRVLFHVPPGFRKEKPFSYLIFLQAPGATVGPALRNLRIMEQVDETKANLILVAPQMAKADDPSPGTFSRPGAFREFLAEVAATLRREMGLEDNPRFDTAPVILATHRGGDRTAAWVLERGGATDRIAGLLLLAPLLEKPDPIGAWAVARHREIFLIALTAPSEEERVRSLIAAWRTQGVPVRDDGLATARPGSIAFLRSAADPARVPLLGPPEGPVYFFLR